MATNAAELVKRAFQGFKPVAKSDPKSPGVVEIDAAKVAEELQKAAHAFSGDGDLDALEKSIDAVESLLAKAADDPTTGVILAPESDIAKRFAKDKVEAPAAPVEKAVTPPAPAAPAPAASPTPAAPAPAPVAKAGEVTPPPAATKPAESGSATPATGKKAPVKKAAEVRWGSDLAAELSDIKKAKGKGKKAAPPEEEEMDDEDEDECDEDALAKDGATSTEQPAATPTAKAEAAPSAEGAETPTTKAADVEWSGDLSAERGNSGPRSQTRLQKVADAVGAASKGRAVARPRPSSALSPDQIAYELQRKSTSREKVRKARIKELKGKGYEPGMGYQPGLVEGVDTRDSGKPLETAGN